jgi:ankyrin repeat protein
VIFSFNMNGIGVLHMAACAGHLEVCEYLVELGGDVNAPGIGAGSISLALSPFFELVAAISLCASMRFAIALSMCLLLQM